jgi:hypothetical protein
MEVNKQLLNELFYYEDGNLFWKNPTGKRIKAGCLAGRNASNGYRMIGLYKRSYMTHRLVFMFHHGYFPKEVDHIDGNKSNNKIENLRPASHLENLRNQKIRTDNVSGHKNVGWAKREQKWRVRLTVNGKDKHIGYFDDRELADLVAVEATNKFHKEFSAYKGVLNGKQ